jgi:hypothetical protein
VDQEHASVAHRFSTCDDVTNRAVLGAAARSSAGQRLGKPGSAPIALMLGTTRYSAGSDCRILARRKYAAGRSRRCRPKREHPRYGRRAERPRGRRDRYRRQGVAPTAKRVGGRRSARRGSVERDPSCQTAPVSSVPAILGFVAAWLMQRQPPGCGYVPGSRAKRDRRSVCPRARPIVKQVQTDSSRSRSS